MKWAASVAWLLLLPTGVACADDPSAILVPNLAERLRDLDPRDPLGYFELAEELAVEATDDRGRSLARTLFVLAHEIDRSAPSPLGLAPSVYLALAAIAASDDERRWLLALAGRTPSGPVATAGRGDDDTALLLAQAIGHARAGDPHEMKELLAKEGVRSLAEQRGSTGRRILPLLERVEREGLCPGCRGRRTVRSVIVPPEGPREEVHTLCPICRGNPGPQLSAEEFARTLAVESELLGAEHQQWGAQTWLDLGAPLHDADPDSLAPRFNVDPDAVYWAALESATDPLDGRWVSEAPRE